MARENPLSDYSAEHEVLMAMQCEQQSYRAIEERPQATWCGERMSPGQVRRIILAEHASIRPLLAQLEAAATRLLASPVPSRELRRATRELALRLCTTMIEHVTLEDRILVPSLRVADAWGPVRAAQLADEHAQQRLFLRAFVDMLVDEETTGQALAVATWQLVAVLREDMEAEESGLLCTDLLSDDGIHVDVETG